MKANVYAIEITAYDPIEADERTLYFATGDGFCTAPADTPANTHFSPRVIEAGNFGRFVIDPNLTDGRAARTRIDVTDAHAAADRPMNGPTSTRIIVAGTGPAGLMIRAIPDREPFARLLVPAGFALLGPGSSMQLPWRI